MNVHIKLVLINQIIHCITVTFNTLTFFRVTQISLHFQGVVLWICDVAEGLELLSRNVSNNHLPGTGMPQMWASVTDWAITRQVPTKKDFSPAIFHPSPPQQAASINSCRFSLWCSPNIPLISVEIRLLIRVSIVRRFPVGALLTLTKLPWLFLTSEWRLAAA